jgi:uncharacterized protein YdhG (YjbR/CyaY superfamily)
MNPTTASTVGAYLRDLPPDRRVAMARLCSMIRRSARGVRESMRYGLAFYELDGPLFALESGRRHMSLYVAEKEVVLKHKDALTGVNAAKSFIKFSDLTMPTQAELLKLWDINEEAAAPPATTVKLPATKPAATMTDAINAMASTMRDAMYAAIDIATGTVPAAKGGASKKSPARKTPGKTAAKPAARKAAKKPPTKTAPARKAAKKAAPARRK